MATAFVPQKGVGQGGLGAAAAGPCSAGGTLEGAWPPSRLDRSPGGDVGWRCQSARSSRELGLWLRGRTRSGHRGVTHGDSDCRDRGKRNRGHSARHSPLPCPCPTGWSPRGEKAHGEERERTPRSTRSRYTSGVQGEAGPSGTTGLRADRGHCPTESTKTGSEIFLGSAGELRPALVPFPERVYGDKRPGGRVREASAPSRSRRRSRLLPSFWGLTFHPGLCQRDTVGSKPQAGVASHPPHLSGRGGMVFL